MTLAVNARQEKVRTATWTAITTTTAESAFEMPANAETASLALTGTFGTGGTIIMEVSNDGTNYVAGKDTGGTAISATAAAIFQVPVTFKHYRLKATAGTGYTLAGQLLVRKRGPSGNA